MRGLLAAAACAACVFLAAPGFADGPAALHAGLSRVDMLPDERMKMMEATGRRTVPQIFIGDTHVGGCDDLVALDQRGELLPLLHGAQG